MVCCCAPLCYRMLLLNAAIIMLNIFVVFRGVSIWRLIQRLEVVEWVTRAAPHMPVTMRTIKVLDWTTLPFRRLGQGVAHGVGRGLNAIGRVIPRGARPAAAHQLARNAAHHI